MAFWNKKAQQPIKPETSKVLEHSIVHMQDTTRHTKAFGMSPDSGVTCVIALLLDQPEWDYAIDQESAFENALFAAAKFGIKRPFDEDQKELFAFLEARFAGQQIANFAWGLYTDQTQSDLKKSA